MKSSECWYQLAGSNPPKKTGKLTRVSRTWPENSRSSGGAQDEEVLKGGYCSAILRSDLVSRIRAIHYLGVDRTPHLASKGATLTS